MLRLLLLSLLFVLPLQSIASDFYTVNIAVYKNVKTLNKKLDKLPPALRNTIQIEKRGELHRATTLPTKNKETLQKLLSSYQKVFKDAFIAPVKAK